MALSVPSVGFSRMLKEGARHFKGVEESVLRNIEACNELAATVRSGYGPNGMNKMVINHIEKLFVTNDAATILKEMEVQHPAAKMLVMASQMQEQEIGDGTNMVLIFAGALLEHAEQLIRMGLSPRDIADGYALAGKKALETLPDLCCSTVKNLSDAKEVASMLKPVLMSKQYGCEEFLAELVAKACVFVLPKDKASFNVDNVRVCKILGSGINNSSVVNGMVFKRKTAGDVKKVEKATVALFSCPFDVTQTETKGTVLINTAEELMKFSKGEEDIVEQHIKALSDAGVNVVVAGGKFGDLYIHFLNKYKIMGLRIDSKFDLRRVCKSVGGTVLPKISVPATAELGHCDVIYQDEIGETEVVVVKKESEHGRIATIVVRGSTENLMDDIERAIDDGINIFKALAKDNRLLPGAGAVEIELARQIESYGKVCPGLEQYAIEKYAQALETIPKVLAENAGAKSTEVLSNLYAAHQEGKKTAGFDNRSETGETIDVVAAGILDPFISKHWALKLATNAASTVLRVDQIIVAKQATGGLNPRSGPVDPDD